jgi:hypothetical protein
MTPAKTAVLAASLMTLLVAGCSPSKPANSATDNNEFAPPDPEALAAMNQPTSPTEDKDAPDMDFLIDMAGRSARQALKCDVAENKGPRDVATIDVTFQPTGWSGDVVVQPPHQGTPIGECIKRAFERVPITNFKGSPIQLEQKIDFGKKSYEKATPAGGAGPSTGRGKRGKKPVPAETEQSEEK